MSVSKNLYSKKTSFLNKSNSDFIEQMYLKFIKNDPELPQSWKDYFQDLGEDSSVIINEINGPSWQKNKKISNAIIISEILIPDIPLFHTSKNKFLKFCSTSICLNFQFF